MSTLPNGTLKDDNVSASGIPHDSKSNIILKHALLPSVGYNDSLYQNNTSIVEDVWKDNTAGHSDHRGLAALDDSSINIHERLMKAKNQKVRIWKTFHN